MKRWGRRPFFFGPHFRICGKSQDDYQNLWTFLNWRPFFFLVFTLGFVENRKNFEMKTRVCGNFWTENLLFFGLHLFRLIHTLEFTLINFSRPPKFVSAPPLSRYPGAGPALVAYKLIFVILLYSPSCFGQEIAKEPFGLRVKLQRLVYHTLWSLHAVPFYC